MTAIQREHERPRQLPEDPALFLAPTIKRTSQLQKALTKQISMTSIVHCSSERSLNDMNRERKSLIVVRDHVERLLNMLLEIRRVGGIDAAAKESCFKQLDEYRHDLLEAGQAALLDMPDMNVGAHDAIAQVIGFIDGSIIPDSPPYTPERDSDRSCISHRRMSLEPGFKIGGDKKSHHEVQPDRVNRYRRYSIGPCNPDMFSSAPPPPFPAQNVQAFRELSNVPFGHGMLRRSSTGAPMSSKASRDVPDSFNDSPRETSSFEMYADIPASCSVSAMSCSAASTAAPCGQPQVHSSFDDQRLFSHSSGPAAVGVGYERYHNVPETFNRSQMTAHSGSAASGFGAVSCAAAGGSELCRQHSLRHSCGTSASGATCCACGGSIPDACHDPHSTSHGASKCGRRGRRNHDGMLFVWLGRTVLAGGVALMLLQGCMPKRQQRANKGVRLRLGPVMRPDAPEEMEEIILYPPEVLSRRMRNC